MTTTILHIEDNSGDARLVEEMLKESEHNYTIVHAVRVSEAIKIMKKQQVDIIISDISLPDSQGTQTFNRLQKVAVNQPVIFVTGTHDESLALEALKKGAQDYLLKGQFDKDILLRAIRYAVERNKFQLDLNKAKSRARKLQQKARLLKQKGDQLTQLNDIKDDFISLASHQLRTPATGVKQYIGMLLEGFEGDLTPAQRDLLQVAYESNERQLAIVADLLKVAQIDSGRITLEKQDTDIVMLVKDIIREQTDKFIRNRQNVNFISVEPKIIAKIDIERMRMVIENIVDNAIKYTPLGKNIEIKTIKKNSNVTIAIKDQGVGIEEEDIDKMFKKFSRITNSLSKTVGGSGLGLYWAKKVVDLHGGTILVSSKVNFGTTFMIEFPSGAKNA